jgi:uncharacterized protein YkwD
MKTPTLSSLILVLFCTILFSCAVEDDGIYFDETSEVDDTEIAYSDIEYEILKLVNKHRDSLGLSSLSIINFVSGVADGHTDYMIQNGAISHDNFGQRSQLIMENTNAKAVGENVAYGFSTAKDVVNGWLKSDGHRKIIESKKYTHCGISTICNKTGRNFFTHIFIKK